VTTRITFIAHAPTEALRRAAFPLDEPLLKREKVTTNLKGVEAWSGPEQRAIQTSGVLGLSTRVAGGLRDCDYGRWRGQTLEEIQSQDPEGMLQWLTRPDAAPHGGESIETLIGRAGRWMDEQHAVSHTLAVTHPAVIRAAIVSGLDLPPKIFWRFDIAPLSLTEMYFSRSTWTLRRVGCVLSSLTETAEESKPVNDQL
jgi:broad specificity phosphatase PhoE